MIKQYNESNQKSFCYIPKTGIIYYLNKDFLVGLFASANFYDNIMALNVGFNIGFLFIDGE